VEFSRLRLSGFKSFCDQVELPIHEGLTGIVGPNGCGKSNVVEALRWVMGESSARDLRGNEMDDVLFGGSSLRPAYDIAEVALLVEHAGPQTDADGATNSVVAIAEARAGQWGGKWGGMLEVSRRLSRGSGSTYRINGREARARDVQLIFADAAAGSRSPSIISQGRVTSIIEAKPEERRRLLEDAAGIGGLHSRRREAELKLNATQANLERVEDRLAALDADLAGLRQQAKQAERFRELSEDISELERLVLLAELAAVRGRLAKAIAHDDACQAALAQAQSALQQSAEGVAALAERLPPLNAEVTSLTAELAKGGERLNAMRQQAEARQREDRRLADEAALAEAELARARDELDASRDLEDAARQALEKAIREQQAVDQTHHAATGEQARLAAAAASARDQLEQQRLAVAGLEAGLREAQGTAARLEQRRRAIEAELARTGEVDDEALVTVAARQLQVARREQAEAGELLRHAQRELKAARQAVDQDRAERQDLLERAAAAKSLLQEARTRQQQRAAERQRLAERHSTLAEQEARLCARCDRLHQRLAALDTAAAEAAWQAAREELATLQSARADAAADATASAGELPELEARSRQAQDNLNECRRTLERLTAEANALRGLQRDDSPAAVVDSLRIADGWAPALAAALGDDLLFGRSDKDGCYWRALEPGLLPAWPAALETLDQYVSGEPLLAARLALVGICASPEQAVALQTSLAPGQRLVTRSGGLWRWDGLVKLPEAGSLAEQRVAQRRRLSELEHALPDAERDVEAAQTRAATLEAALTAARLAAEEARRQETTTERKCNEARHAEEALARRLDDLRGQGQRLEAERDELNDEQQALQQERAALAALPEPDAAADPSISALAQDSQLLDDALAAVRQRADGSSEALDRLEREVARQRELETGKAQAAAQAESLFERRQGEAQGRKQSRQAAVEGMQREIRDVDAELADCGSRIVARQARLATARETLSALADSERQTAAGFEQARADLAEQEAAKHRLAERVPTLRAQIGRLADDQKRSAATLAQAEQRRQRLAIAKAALDDQAGGPTDADLEQAAQALASGQQRLDRLKATLAESARQHAAALAAKEAASEASVRAREVAATAAAARQQCEAEAQSFADAARRGLGTSPDPLLAEPTLQQALAAHTLAQLEARLDALKLRRERMGPVNLRAAIEIEERARKLAQQRSEADDHEPDLTGGFEANETGPSLPVSALDCTRSRA